MNVWDRYSWNESKDNWPMDVTDPDMARLQTVGLAEDFNMRGSSSVTHYDYQRPGRTACTTGRGRRSRTRPRARSPTPPP